MDPRARRGLAQPAVPEVATRHRRSAGRDPGDVATIYNLPGGITATPLAATRDGDGRWVGGSVGQWVDELTGAVLEHGASGFIHFGARGTPADVSIERWAQEVVPAVRDAVAKEV